MSYKTNRRTPTEMMAGREFVTQVRTRRGEYGPHRRIYPTRGGLWTIGTDQRIANSDRRSRSYRPGDVTELGNLMTYRIRKLQRLSATTAIPYGPILKRFDVVFSDGSPVTSHYTEIFVDANRDLTDIQEIWGGRNTGYPTETGWANAYIKLLWKEGEGVSPTLP